MGRPTAPVGPKTMTLGGDMVDGLGVGGGSVVEVWNLVGWDEQAQLVVIIGLVERCVVMGRSRMREWFLLYICLRTK